jgi:hypothetical protein
VEGDSNLETDDDWLKPYGVAVTSGDYLSAARLLSGRLRQMDKRARAANRRAGAAEAENKAMRAALLQALPELEENAR